MFNNKDNYFIAQLNQISGSKRSQITKSDCIKKVKNVILPCMICQNRRDMVQKLRALSKNHLSRFVIVHNQGREIRLVNAIGHFFHSFKFVNCHQLQFSPDHSFIVREKNDSNISHWVPMPCLIVAMIAWNADVHLKGILKKNYWRPQIFVDFLSPNLLIHIGNA